MRVMRYNSKMRPAPAALFKPAKLPRTEFNAFLTALIKRRHHPFSQTRTSGRELLSELKAPRCLAGVRFGVWKSALLQFQSLIHPRFESMRYREPCQSHAPARRSIQVGLATPQACPRILRFVPLHN